MEKKKSIKVEKMREYLLSQLDTGASPETIAQIITHVPLDLLRAPLITWNSVTLTHYCALKGYPQILDFLCSHRFSPDERDSMGRTPLHYAASNNQLGSLLVLLKHGASINAQTNGGDTALMKAVEGGHANIVKELVKWNCDFRIRNGCGRTAEDIARLYGTQLTPLAFENAILRTESRVLLLYLYFIGKPPFNTLPKHSIPALCNYL